MRAPPREGGVEMTEVFADDTVLVRRVHIVAKTFQLVKKIATIERVKLGQEGGECIQLLEPPVEFPEGRETGQFLTGRVAHGVSRNGVAVEWLRYLGNDGHIDEKRIHGHHILKIRTCFVGKMEVPAKVVGLEDFSPEERRDSE